MDLRLTRRHFLGGAAAAGASTLLPGKGVALSTESDVKSGTTAGADTAITSLTRASVAKTKWKAEPFSMTEVRLLPSFWKDTMELDRSYLYSLPNDRLAHNFRVTAGIPSDADPLGGWEAPDCELRGHYVGHYLSSCALLHASAGDQAIAAKAKPEDAIWFEQVEATRRYPLQFQTKGRGPIHSLVPLNQIMDERYSVYVRNEGV